MGGSKYYNLHSHTYSACNNTLVDESYENHNKVATETHTHTQFDCLKGSTYRQYTFAYTVLLFSVNESEMETMINSELDRKSVKVGLRINIQKTNKSLRRLHSLRP